MKKAPNIDIIIPIYNAEKFIGQTLDSLAYQNYTNFNVLCYNDGSTDNSETIVKEFAKKDKRVRLLGSKKIGLVNALNFLIKNARSKLLIRLDADDICEKNRIKILVNSYKKNNADIYYSNYTLIDENGSFLFPFIKIAPHHSKIEKFMRWRNPICHSTVMYKRNIFKKVSYTRNYDGAEDYRLWVDCLIAGFKFIKVPHSLVRYRIHKNQLTQKRFLLNHERQKKITKDFRRVRPISEYDNLLESYSKNKNISNLNQLILNANSKDLRFRMLLNFFFAKK